MAELQNQERGTNVTPKELQGVECVREDDVSGKNVNKEADLGSLHGLVESLNQANSGDVMAKTQQDVEGAVEYYERTGLAGGLIDERSASVINIVKTSAIAHKSDFFVNRTNIDTVQLTTWRRDLTTQRQANISTEEVENKYAAVDKDHDLVTCRTKTSDVSFGGFKTAADGTGMGRMYQEDVDSQSEARKVIRANPVRIVYAAKIEKEITIKTKMKEQMA